jgi:hypothetical protein
MGVEVKRGNKDKYEEGGKGAMEQNTGGNVSS